MTPGNSQPPDRWGSEPGQDTPQTASGLEEKHIHPEDLAMLQGLFKSNTVAIECAPRINAHNPCKLQLSLPAQGLHQMVLGIGAPRSLVLRIVQVTPKASLRRFGWKAPKVRFRRDLKAALSQRILRRRHQAGDLAPAVRQALYEAIFKQYGTEARKLEVRAIFPHVPPEAAPSLRIGQHCEAASFVWPEHLPVRRAKVGHYFVVLQSADGKTSNAFFRLE